jgi:hypothetical protein
MINRTALARTATGVTHLARLAIIVLFAACLALWIDPDIAARSLAQSLPGLDGAYLPFWALMIGFGLGVIPLLVLSYALVHGLFQLYRGSDILSYRRRGPAAQVRHRPLRPCTCRHHCPDDGPGHVLTHSQPHGARQLEIGVSSSELFILLIGALVIMILSEAHRLADENRQFV